MAKRYCGKGHDTLVVGRVQRMCRSCRRMNDRARYAKKKRAGWLARMLRWLYANGD